MPPKKQRTDELRKALVEAAIDVLAEEGVTGVTTRDVAARAGTSPPAIYELFDSRAGLIRAVFFEGFGRLERSLASTAAPTGRTSDIVDAVRVFREFAQANPRLFEVMYSRPFADFRPSRQEQQLGDTTRHFLVDRSRACVEAGSLRGDPVDIAHAVLGLVIGLATQESAGWLGTTAASRTRRWNMAIDALVSGFVDT